MFRAVARSPGAIRSAREFAIDSPARIPDRGSSHWGINGDGFADVLLGHLSDLNFVFGSAIGLPVVIDSLTLNGDDGISFVSDEY